MLHVLSLILSVAYPLMAEDSGRKIPPIGMDARQGIGCILWTPCEYVRWRYPFPGGTVAFH